MNQLECVKYNRANLCADLYHGLVNAADENACGNVNLHGIDKAFIPHFLHIASLRNMFELFQDSLAITKFHQHLDIFGTIMASFD